MRSHTNPARRAPLGVSLLEARDVPAGSITVPPISATGLLTVTGDDDANDVQIQLTGSGVVLTSLSGTTLINGSPNPVTLSGLVKSIKADFKGGADDVSVKPDAPNADFVLSGPATFGLGDGDNLLTLVTTGRIGLGGLTVTGGDGTDTVTVQGGANSTIGGVARFTYANGGSSTALDGVTFTAVTLTAGDGVGVPNALTGTNVTVTGALKANLGNSFPGIVDLTGGAVGGLTVMGHSPAALLAGVTATRGVTVKGVFDALAQVDGGSVTGNVAVTAANANFVATGAGTKVTGNLTLTGSAWTSADFGTTGVTEVTGNVTVKGGWYNDVFTATETFKVGRNVSLKLGDGDNAVTVGTGAAAVTFGGSLTVQTGAGRDTVELRRVSVAGPAILKLGGGVDVLSLEDATTFAKTVLADLGTGDDTISVAQDGGAGPVTFTGKATVKAGAGNDTLLLGVAVDLGGDGTTRANFNTAGSVVDGGTGLNTFEPADGQFSTNVTFTNW